MARQSSATVYTVAIREVPAVKLWGQSAPPSATDDRFVRSLAQQTGGRVMHAERNRDIGPAFERVLAEFQGRYVLGYTPAGVSGRGWRPVEVRLTKRRGTVLARRGYFAE